MRYLILLFLAFLTLNCSSGDTSSSKPKEWYEGGTLHKANAREWNLATNENKLATCGDFVSRADDSQSLEEIKRRATELRSCVNEATIEPGTDDMKVSEVATLCIILLGYQKK